MRLGACNKPLDGSEGESMQADNKKICATPWWRQLGLFTSRGVDGYYMTVSAQSLSRGLVWLGREPVVTFLVCLCFCVAVKAQSSTVPPVTRYSDGAWSGQCLTRGEALPVCASYWSAHAGTGIYCRFVANNRYDTFYTNGTSYAERSMGTCGSACPANSTLTGSVCTCNPGYASNGSAANACVPSPTYRRWRWT